MTDTKPATAAIIAPPPTLYISSFLLGLLLQLVFPLRIVNNQVVAFVIASLLLISNALLARWAFVTMRQQNTSADPRDATTALVTSGPFRFSRNPVYVAMTGLYIGLAFLLNSWGPLLLLLPLLLIMHWGVIHREEQYLAQCFGETYLTYKLTTRRWL